MADDGQSVKPERAPEAVGLVRDAIATSTHGEPSTSSETGRSISWHPVMFLVILLVAAIVGFHFESNAKPGAAPSSFIKQPPQYINVYEANPLVPLTVSVLMENKVYLAPVSLRAQGYTNFSENVDVTATSPRSVPPGTVMIMSSTAPSPEFGNPSAPIKNRSIMAGFAVQVQLSWDGKTWSGVASFGSIPIIFQDNGSTFGHLPSFGAFEFPEGDTPTLLAEYDRGTGKLRTAIFGPAQKNSNLGLGNPSSYDVLPGDRGEIFWGPGGPDNISYTETLHNIVPALRNEQMVYSIPSEDINGDIDYEWHSAGCCGLEPTFKATDPEAADSQNQAAFISGIAFGVAGSAAIAVVGELPKEFLVPAWWPQRKRKRK
jgi:hypothetical protein